jgi:hypothetical protein
MNLTDLVHRTALRVKLNKVSGSVIHHIAILKRALEQKNIQCEFIQGYAVIPVTKEACMHFWLQEKSTGLNLDIGFEIAKLKSPELQALHPILLDQVPEGIQRSDVGDADSEETQRSNMEQFKMYHENEKEFWKLAPYDVKTFSIKF